MSERIATSSKALSRRTVIKGLIGVTLTLAEIGCAPIRSSPASPTPTSATATLTPAPITPPTPTSTTLPKPGTLGSTLFTYRGHTALVDAVVWHGARIASGSEDGRYRYGMPLLEVMRSSIVVTLLR
ncbi:MAG: WD40 domain-containing protein [Chloroflexota bacterium]|nr:WD40 domain-containing protein [Chloroflexota bacterium]